MLTYKFSQDHTELFFRAYVVVESSITSIANLIPNNPEGTDSIANRNVEGLFESIVHSKVTGNILFYISGYVIRKKY